MNGSSLSRRRRGMSLVEVLLALGVFSLFGIGLIGLLVGGVKSARLAQTDYRVFLLAENLQARFEMEPGWPGGSPAGEFLLFYDTDGTPVKEDAAVYVVGLRAVAPNAWQAGNWRSNRLELKSAEIRTAQGLVLQRFMLARTLP